jgi:hypothetical protein
MVKFPETTPASRQRVLQPIPFVKVTNGTFFERILAFLEKLLYYTQMKVELQKN